MKIYFLVLILVAWEMGGSSAQAQTNDMDTVKKQLQEMQESVRQMQMKHQEELDALKKSSTRSRQPLTACKNPLAVRRDLQRRAAQER